MEERQKQIQVGAGLQESRLNTDLILWLEKYGWPVLTVVLIGAVIYFGWVRLQAWRDDRVDRAFEQYQAARGTLGPDGVLQGSPDGLLRVAEEHAGKGSVAALARLDAAEIYLGAARRGLRAGVDINAFIDEDVLKPEQVDELVKQAQGIFQRVADDTASNEDFSVLNVRALWGVASSAISLGDAERAKTALNAIVEKTTKMGFPEEAGEAKRRMEALPRLMIPVMLLSDAALPALPKAAPASQFEQDLIEVEKLDQPPPGFDPTLEGPPTTTPEGEQPPATLPPVQVPDPKPQPPQEQPKQPG